MIFLIWMGIISITYGAIAIAIISDVASSYRHRPHRPTPVPQRSFRSPSDRHPQTKTHYESKPEIVVFQRQYPLNNGRLRPYVDDALRRRIQFPLKISPTTDTSTKSNPLNCPQMNMFQSSPRPSGRGDRNDDPFPIKNGFEPALDSIVEPISNPPGELAQQIPERVDRRRRKRERVAITTADRPVNAKRQRRGDRGRRRSITSQRPTQAKRRCGLRGTNPNPGIGTRTKKSEITIEISMEGGDGKKRGRRHDVEEGYRGAVDLARASAARLRNLQKSFATTQSYTMLAQDERQETPDTPARWRSLLGGIRRGGSILMTRIKHGAGRQPEGGQQVSADDD